MRVFAVLGTVLIGAFAGGAAAVFFISTCVNAVGIPNQLLDSALLIGAVSVLAGAGIGGGVVYRFWDTRKRKSRPHLLTPDAEKDARAKFMPSSDTAANDPSIQPDKRNVKPGDH